MVLIHAQDEMGNVDYPVLDGLCPESQSLMVVCENGIHRTVGTRKQLIEPLERFVKERK